MPSPSWQSNAAGQKQKPLRRQERSGMSNVYYECADVAHPVAKEILALIIRKKLSYQEARETLLITKELMEETTCPMI